MPLFRWGLMTITTVGYDLNPSTLLGQLLWLWKTISTSINKVCMKAIFVNILSRAIQHLHYNLVGAQKASSYLANAWIKEPPLTSL